MRGRGDGAAAPGPKVALGLAAAFGLLAGQACGPATGGVTPRQLSVTANDALREARTVAVDWAPETRLRYVEGEGVSGSGRVLPDGGSWRFVYDSPDRSEQLAVTVTPRAIDRVTRPPQSPAGFVLDDDDGGLDVDWIDSPQALAAVRASEGGMIVDRDDAAIALVLLPGRPPQWVVRATAGGTTRQWRVNALTGAVMD